MQKLNEQWSIWFNRCVLDQWHAVGEQQPGDVLGLVAIAATTLGLVAEVVRRVILVVEVKN